LQKKIAQHHVKLSFPHHEHIKEGGLPLGPKVGYKCCDTLRTKGWERLNLMCNMVEKTYEVRWKKKDD